MIPTIDLRGRELDEQQLRTVIPRVSMDVEAVLPSVGALVDEVRERGEAALNEQAQRFDGIRPTSLRVPPAEIAAALDGLIPPVRSALETAIERVRRAAAAQVPPQTVTEIAPGATITQRWQPMGRAGLYVPGGRAVYPSSVVMNVVPAQVAGVESIAIASPAQKDFDGGVHPTILAAAGLLGIDEVYAMGGAGAVGALAYGVESVGLEPVDIITGPGNIFVAAAKRLVRGTVAIDSEAGPSEILVIADETADPRFVAADLISQAEHGAQSAAVLVTDSEVLAEAVQREVDEQVAGTRHREGITAALTSDQSAVVLVADMTEASRVSNAYGPEHLEIQTADPHAVLAEITTAGAVFVGPHAPVSLGDYLAGSNHVLPTGGQARFAAGLSASTFLRAQQVVAYDAVNLADAVAPVTALTDCENFPAHAAAVTVRFDEGR